MKKSKKIQLILISAALASCNRHFAPARTADWDITDTTLAARQAQDTDSCANDDISCLQEPFQLWNYSFDPFGNFYYWHGAYPYYSQGRRSRKGMVWHGGKGIIRGGWGKSGKASSAAS